MNPISAFINRITGKASRKAKSADQTAAQKRANDAMDAMLKH